MHLSLLNSFKSSLLILLILVAGVSLSAQDHVTLNNGDVIEGKLTDIKLITSIGDFARVRCDGEKYTVNKVTSFKHGNDYYISVQKKYFLKAYIHGKISAFHFDEQHRDFSKMSTTGSVMTSQDYFLIQKGEEDKPVSMSYKNLEEMVSDNPEVLAELNAMEKKRQGSRYSDKEKVFLEQIERIITHYNKN